MAATRSAPHTEVTTDWTDFVHTGPGTLAGRYLRSFWQPVARSVDLPAGRARPLRCMSQDFTLYRGEGGDAHVLDFRCAHRGTQLSTGWVEGDNLRCFYHGWVYDQQGQCVEQPAEPEPFCSRIKIKSYPTREYLGLVFAYLGEGDPPELPSFPEYDEAPFVGVTTYTRACNYFQATENGIDPAHVLFTHTLIPYTFEGVRSGLQVAETGYGVIVTWPEADGSTGSLLHAMPNINVRPTVASGGGSGAISWRVPIDDETHIAFNLGLSNGRRAQSRGTPSAADTQASMAHVQELTDQIMAGQLHIDDVRAAADPNVVNVEDTVTQTGQGAITDRSTEHLGRADASLVLWRRVWQRELQAFAEGRPLTQWVPTSGLE